MYKVKYSICLCLMLFSNLLFAQKRMYEGVSYLLPKGWTEQELEGGMQLSNSDEAKGNYSVAVIMKTKLSSASPEQNFKNDWEKLVLGTVKPKSAAIMQDPTTEKGWDLISGSANYTDGGTTGFVNLITATSKGRTISMILMTNAKLYQEELLALIESLEIEALSATGGEVSAPASNNALVGLWVDYQNENNGFINGSPMYTGGYLRKDYQFFADGTYQFRSKIWLTKARDISFIYEKGTYVIGDHELQLFPKEGKSGFWKKSASNRTNEWGALSKSNVYPLENTKYSFEFISYQAGGETRYLVLKASNSTSRDRSTNGSSETENKYRLYEKPNSLIDFPPGFKTK